MLPTAATLALAMGAATGIAVVPTLTPAEVVNGREYQWTILNWSGAIYESTNQYSWGFNITGPRSDKGLTPPEFSAFCKDDIDRAVVDKGAAPYVACDAGASKDHFVAARLYKTDAAVPGKRLGVHMDVSLQWIVAPVKVGAGAGAAAATPELATSPPDSYYNLTGYFSIDFTNYGPNPPPFPLTPSEISGCAMRPGGCPKAVGQ